MEMTVSKTEEIQKQLDEALSRIEALSEENRNLRENLTETQVSLKLAEEKLRRVLKRMFGSNSEHIARDGDMYE